jgi:hypothetical protein
VGDAVAGTGLRIGERLGHSHRCCSRQQLEGSCGLGSSEACPFVGWVDLSRVEGGCWQLMQQKVVEGWHNQGIAVICDLNPV